MNFQEDECDLVDDDFFQNLMKKPEADEADISEYLNTKQETPFSPIIEPPSQTLNQKIALEVRLGYFPLLKQKYEIFQLMLKKEEMLRKNYVSINVFEKQTELNSDMRLMLLDWICQVSSDYCLKR